MKLIVCSEREEVRQRWLKATRSIHEETTEVRSAKELRNTLQAMDKGVVLLHRTLTDMPTIIELMIQHSGIGFFIFSDRPFDNEGLVLLHNGAAGYANTYMAPERLVKAVEVIISGSVWVGRKLMNLLVRNLGPQEKKSDDGGRPETISEREWQVAEMIGDGSSNLEIAAELGISEATVKAHVGSLFKKTATESRLQLALYLKNTM